MFLYVEWGGVKSKLEFRLKNFSENNRSIKLFSCIKIEPETFDRSKRAVDAYHSG